MQRRMFLYALLVFVIQPLYSHAALTKIQDNELADVAGQSLFALTYIAPSQQGNPSNDIGFYRLGLDAEIALNANVRRIQLGCGGVNGPGLCDIDLSNVSLTGTQPSPDGSYAGSDAIFKNPFYEFAIRNPNSASSREVVGIRLGSLSALGVLSVGTNDNPNNLSDDTGINSISGDMNLTISNSKMSNGCVTFLGVCSAPFEGNFLPYNKTFVVQRAQSLTLDGLGAQTTSVSIFGILNLPLGLTIPNITVEDQPLRALHRMLIASNAAGTAPTSDFYLSVQKEAIQWQKISNGQFNDIPAQRGWWMSVPNAQVTGLDVTQYVPVPATDVINGLFGGQVTLAPVDLGQKPAKNCWGTLTFC